uniref:Uncharacterized protein LOC100186222 n=1 Tax=Phallusia mammillata TaxID=59560 RepID=A0A6F9DIG1_9ASCI|nr:uncharacterized protein LOC100186222 [Phallusia mammillata]
MPFLNRIVNYNVTVDPLYETAQSSIDKCTKWENFRLGGALKKNGAFVYEEIGSKRIASMLIRSAHDCRAPNTSLLLEYAKLKPDNLGNPLDAILEFTGQVAKETLQDVRTNRYVCLKALYTDEHFVRQGLARSLLYNNEVWARYQDYDTVLALSTSRHLTSLLETSGYTLQRSEQLPKFAEMSKVNQRCGKPVVKSQAFLCVFVKRLCRFIPKL